MLGDSLRRRRGRGEKPVRDEPDRPRTQGPRGYGWAHWLVAALVVLGGSFAVGYLLSTQILFPRPETAGTGVPVPALYGDSRTEAESALTAAGLSVGEVTELPSMDADPGVVLAQAPIPGQQLRRGAAVSFAVSSGPQALRVPPVRGLGTETAREMLESLGFDVEVREEDGAGGAGRVLTSEPVPGTARTLPALVTLVATPAPADTLGPAPDAAGPGGPAGAPAVGDTAPGVGADAPARAPR